MAGNGCLPLHPVTARDREILGPSLCQSDKDGGRDKIRGGKQPVFHSSSSLRHQHAPWPHITRNCLDIDRPQIKEIRSNQVPIAKGSMGVKGDTLKRHGAKGWEMGQLQPAMSCIYTPGWWQSHHDDAIFRNFCK